MKGGDRKLFILRAKREVKQQTSLGRGNSHSDCMRDSVGISDDMKCNAHLQ